MRIAYIAPYQGAELMQRRPIVGNLSLGARMKMEVISDLLRRSSHDVEILSQGEIIKHQFWMYKGFREQNAFDERIPVYYSSAFPVKFVNGLWSGLSLLRLFKARHRIYPFDAVLIYNFKVPQIICARYAIRRLDLPVILEYEDDALVNTAGEKEEGGLRTRWQLSMVKTIFKLVSAGIGISPQMLNQLPASTPKLLLRGVVSDEIAKAVRPPAACRKNIVVFSGTLFRTKGLEQLIEAWQMIGLPDWELHITGDGELYQRLRDMATHCGGIVFHGLLNRSEYVRLLCSAKIGINPHDVSRTLGNVFAFKIVEYLAAGAHVISTPMGQLGPEIEKAITYIPDNRAETIARALRRVIESRSYERTAAEPTLQVYGPAAVSRALDELLNKVLATNSENRMGETKGKFPASNPVSAV